MADRVAIIFNPTKIEPEDIKQAASKAAAGIDDIPEFLYFETTPEDEGQGIAAQALWSSPSLIIASGGDGTVRAVADGIVQSDAKVDFGIVPQGTGNILARNLGIPLGDPVEAIRVALTSPGKAMDVGRIEFDGPSGSGSEVFTVLCGFGLDAEIMNSVDEDTKKSIGWLAYVAALKEAAQNTEQVQLSISVDGGQPEDRSVHTLVVGNCGQLQGGVPLLPDASPFDGVLDLLAIEGGSAKAWAETAKTMLWDKGVKRLFTGEETDGGKDIEAEHTTARQVAKVAVSLPEPHLLEVDGDVLGEVTKFSVEVLPKAISVRH